LATKDKKPAAKKAATTSKVTRIKASDETVVPKKKPAAKKATPATTAKTGDASEIGIRNPLGPIGRYFKGAWYELKQVRWPDRKATWGLTLAVIAFTAFFVVLILLLDALFKYVFQLILG
jgi:preprotein translocase SecE subunit